MSLKEALHGCFGCTIYENGGMRRGLVATSCLSLRVPVSSSRVVATFANAGVGCEIQVVLSHVRLAWLGVGECPVHQRRTESQSYLALKAAPG